ncbi:hypothetical protein MUN89_18215 [Halobacillus salinarum]|uniref:Lipoprotein n=1 Tax=Halobacillus salinarum TaxID=2932257 RepID=A0ABY4EH43_9BACI|nr:hypothetical protein [Halobacillus salinarum]UOQ43793.1 hypothetical protein MUN89_18215 [Halobacillus salinarum]
MKTKLLFLATLLLLAGCSSDNLSLKDLKEAYPDKVAAPLQSLSKEEQDVAGFPEELPFTPKSVKASVDNKQVRMHYQKSEEEKVMVRSIFQPDDIIQESELQIPLNSGAVAGVQEKEDYVFVEWYNSEDDVLYQLEYTSSKKEDRTKRAIDIANSI